jgi:hypothetical protein
MAKEFYKTTVRITKGSKESEPLYLGGSRVRAVGIPTDQAGQVNISGSLLSFYGTYDGFQWFSVNDVTGKSLLVPTRVQQNYLAAPSALPAADAILPLSLPNAELFSGIQTIILVSNIAEVEDRLINVFYEPNK